MFLLTEREHRVLMGRLYELVAPLIDGKRSTEVIVEALNQQASAAEVYYALGLLETQGYVMESRECGSPEMAAFWTANDIDPDVACNRLQKTKVSVASIGKVPVEQFLTVLESMGIQTDEEGDLVLVLADDYLAPGLEACNREALKEGRPWMLVKPVGQEIFVGPIFIPGKTGCWGCLRDRYVQHRRVEHFVMSRLGRSNLFPLATVHAPAVVQVALNMAAVEVTLWIARGENPDLAGKIISLDSWGWQVRHHTLVRRSLCPDCGPKMRSTDEMKFEPLKLVNRKIAFARDCGYRTVLPEDTFKKYEHLVSPVIGVVDLLEKPESIAPPLHVYLAGVQFIFGNESLASLKAGPSIVSSGKGFSEAQARASALCEALERCSGYFGGSETRLTASRSELGDQAIHPNDCMLYSSRQYDQRDYNNAKNPDSNLVPEPFDDSVQIEWSPVWSLTHETVKYLPTQYLYFGYYYPDGKADPVYSLADSNGNAAGNTLEEAVLQGLLELMERDCVALWWYNMLKKPAVDLASFNDSSFMEVLDSYKRLNRRVWVLDITSDLDIPAFAAISKKIDQRAEQIIFGFGCHLDARLAIQRALGELNQKLSPFLTLSQEYRRIVLDSEDIEETRSEKPTCENQPYLIPGEILPIKQRKTSPQFRSSDILEEILKCKKVIEERGMEILILDQTRPDIGMPVAKVVCPGLRHRWPRFAPGRLYDVPVQMGWLKQPRKEEELNPVPLVN